MAETVIALFILAVGLLAVQAMQLTSLRTNVSASMRTDAQFLAEDMADRIMAYSNQSLLNPLLVTPADDYNGIDTNGAAVDPGCSAGGCNTAQQRALDLFDWKTELEARLPGGRGTVNVVGNEVTTITVMWDNDRTGANGTGCSGDSQVDLACYSVQLNLQ
ncbi:hypothetical protein R50073_05200 [Maricurvus nonylphenolicus]